MADEIREMGNDVFAYVCDCSKREEVYRTAHQVREEVGNVAVLVNNAGIVGGKKFLDSIDSQTEKVFEVNALAHYWVRSIYSLVPRLHSPAFYRIVYRDIKAGEWSLGTRLGEESVLGSVEQIAVF